MNYESLVKKRNCLLCIGDKIIKYIKDELSKNEPDKCFAKCKLNELKKIVSELEDMEPKILEVLPQEVSVDELAADFEIVFNFSVEVTTLEELINENLGNKVYPENNSYEDKLGDSVDKENRYELTKPKIKEEFEEIVEMAPKNELLKEGQDISPNSIPAPKNIITDISLVPEIPDQTVCIISCNDHLSSDMNVKGLSESQVDAHYVIKVKNDVKPLFRKEKISDPEIQILLPIEYDSLAQHPENLGCEPCFETEHSENSQFDGSCSETVRGEELSDFTFQLLAKVGEFSKVPRPRWEKTHLQRETPQTDHVNRDCFVVNELDKELNATYHRPKYDTSIFSRLINRIFDLVISKRKETFFKEDFAGLPKVKIKLIFSEN